MMPTELRPAVRASVALNQLEAWRRRPPSGAAEPAVPVELVDSIRRHGRMDWVPMSNWAMLCDAMRAACGDEDYRRFWRAIQIEMIDQPIFRNLVQGAVRLFGLRPSSFGKIVPKAFPMVFRDCGEFRCAVEDEGAMRLELSGFPVAHFRSGTMVVGFSGAFGAFFDVCHVEGTVEAEEDRPAGAATFHLRWRASK
jgi:hypothetical protein